MKNWMKHCNIMPAAGLHAGTNFRLLHGETKLEDDQLVSHYNICDGSKIVLEKQLQVHVYIKGDEEKTITVAAWESDTMAQLMHTAGIEPREEYLLDSKSSLIQPHRTTRQQQMLLPHVRKEMIAYTDTCWLLPSDDGSDASKSLFLLDRRLIMKIHLHIIGDVAALLGVDEDDDTPFFTATVTPSFTVRELRDIATLHLKLLLGMGRSTPLPMEILTAGHQLLHGVHTLSFYKITDDFHLIIR